MKVAVVGIGMTWRSPAGSEPGPPDDVAPARAATEGYATARRRASPP